MPQLMTADHCTVLILGQDQSAYSLWLPATDQLYPDKMPFYWWADCGPFYVFAKRLLTALPGPAYCNNIVHLTRALLDHTLKT